MAKPTGKPSHSVPLRLDAEQKRKIKQAAALIGISAQDVMRLAMGVGIEALRRVDWNLKKVVADAAFPDEKTSKIVPLNLVPDKLAAEQPPPKKGSGPPGDE